MTVSRGADLAELTVNLTSSNSAQATVAVDRDDSGDSTSATFAINAVDDGIVETSRNSVTDHGYHGVGVGYTSGTATLTVTNIDVAKTLTVNLNPTTISEGDGKKAATGTVTCPCRHQPVGLDRHPHQQQHRPGHG